MTNTRGASKGKRMITPTFAADKKPLDGGDIQGIHPVVQAVRKVFTEAQRSTQCHQRCYETLDRLLFKHKCAWTEFFSCVSRILVVFNRDPGVERLVQFVSLVAASSNETCSTACDAEGSSRDRSSLLVKTVEFLLERSRATDKAVRFRCCQLVGGILAVLVERGTGEEPDGLGDQVVEVLLPRLRDKVAAVRVHAVEAVKLLQIDDDDPSRGGPGQAAVAASGENGDEDQVTKEILRVMMSDSSPDVRKAALAAITKRPGMLDQLVLRTQDVKESVRMATFRTIGEHVSPKHLQPHQRVKLMQRGLSESSKAVYDACRLMLGTHWLRDSSGDPVELLHHFAVCRNEKLSEKIVREIVGLGLKADREREDPSLGMGLTLAEAKALRQAARRSVEVTANSAPKSGSEDAPGDDGGKDAGFPRTGGRRRISPEEALFARVKAEVVKDDKKLSAAEREARLAEILPDTISLCESVETLSQALSMSLAELEQGFTVDTEEDVFVVQQLLKLAALADFSEEAGRRRLVNLLQSQLVDAYTHHDLVEVSMAALAAAHPSEADLVRLVAELISDVSDHLRVHQPMLASLHKTSLDATGASAPAEEEKSKAGALPSTPEPGGMHLSLAQSVVAKSAIRAAIPKNFVKDRARMFEGGGLGGDGSGEDPAATGLLPAEGCHDGAGGVSVDGTAAGRGDVVREGVVASGSVSGEEFVDALSHVGSSDDAGGDATPARGSPGDAAEGDEEGHGEEKWADDDPAWAPRLNRMFRILDMLSALLTKTKQTLVKDPTLAGFEDTIMEAFKWSTEVPRDVAADLRGLGVTCLGKYSLLGEAAALSHRPRLMEIAMCEEEEPAIRSSALQALSDMSLIYGAKIVAPGDDLVSLYTGILKNRELVRGGLWEHYRGMVAVAAEAAARLLFFGLVHAPEMLARLVVMYFERRSAADPLEDQQGEEENEEASCVGSSVRLSQILGVYFMSIPAAGGKIRDMLSESVRHVLRLVREIAEINFATVATLPGKWSQELLDSLSKFPEDDKDEDLIDVPVQDVIRFILELLMQEGRGSGSSADVEKKDSSGKEHLGGNEDEDEDEDEGKDKDKEKGVDENGDPKGMEEATVEDPTKPAEGLGGSTSSVDGASGHVALCVADELYTCCGMDGLTDTMLCLAKVLASLPLPEDDQVTIKRLRARMDRLLALGDKRLTAKVSRVIKKYAQVLYNADLTPEEGVEDGSECETVAYEQGSSLDTADEACADEDPEDPSCVSPGSEAQGSCPRAPESRRPTRQSKLVARARLTEAASVEATASAIADALSSDDETSVDDEEGSGGTRGCAREQGDHVGESTRDQGTSKRRDSGDGDDDDDDDEDDDDAYDSDQQPDESDDGRRHSTGTAKSASPMSKEKLRSKPGSGGTPLVEIRNGSAPRQRSSRRNRVS